MRKYNCTTSGRSTTYFVVVVADDEQHATEMAQVRARQKWGSGIAGQRWNVEYVDSGYSSPARILDFGTI